MFGRFICVNFMKTGKCEDRTCKLSHVDDIGSLSMTKVARP